ncbi:hypothetical protein RFI_11072 [Reticulomyxa filosa]|uniref:Uncharacterized protein n=1 Tax=Reticulomyxa filosa TaxID=46433 RepID=X6NIB6_RETFI|nr:hypothetical protein RFI_11072 [Reticulomyxa filosa]|eukprot:ETO26065.1 hypothetical protein RFI_11072 [Reticulomyxa filosa]
MLYVVKKELKCDELRMAAFNNMAAVYANEQNWEECKNQCTQVIVLKNDEKNTKALFRRAKAYRHLGLHELACCDLVKAQELTGTSDPTIEAEMKLLKKDIKNADNAFLQSMRQGMKKAQSKKKKGVTQSQSQPQNQTPQEKTASQTDEQTQDHPSQQKDTTNNDNIPDKIKSDDFNQTTSQEAEK